MQTVISTVNLANPGQGAPLPAGVPVLVDDSDPFVAAAMDAAYLVPAPQPSGDEQTWDESADPITTPGMSEMGAPTPPPAAATPDTADETAATPPASAKTTTKK